MAIGRRRHGDDGVKPGMCARAKFKEVVGVEAKTGVVDPAGVGRDASASVPQYGEIPPRRKKKTAGYHL